MKVNHTLGSSVGHRIKALNLPKHLRAFYTAELRKKIAQSRMRGSRKGYAGRIIQERDCLEYFCEYFNKLEINDLK